MHSEIGIDIAAPADLVFTIARDVERWSDLLPHYARSNAVDWSADGRITAQFVARRPLIPLLGLGIPVAWRSQTWSDPTTRRLQFRHVAGVTRGMDVTWTIEPIEGDPGRCRVVIAHEFRPRLPGLAWFVDRYFTRAIAGRTLATFRAIAEAVADSQANDAIRKSERALSTNHGP